MSITGWRLGRSGMMFPVVLLALIIFVIVGMTTMFSGTSEYQQTGVVTYGMVTNQLVIGVLEEMQALVYDKVNNIEQGQGIWREEIIAAAKAGGKVENKDLIPELVDSKAAVDAVKGSIVTASVSFVGLRFLKYSGSNTYDSPTAYYKKAGMDSKAVKAPGGTGGTATDYVGSYRLQAAVRFGKSLRYYSVTKDLKIIDTSPPAREFVLFSFWPLGIEEKLHADTALNSGGPMHIFANDKGRIYVKGPYFLNISDDPQGIGGKRPAKGKNASPPDVSFFNTDEWWNHTLLPSPHEGLMGGSFNNREPGRPDETSKFSASLNLAGFDFFNDDPGMNMPNGQQWFVGNKPWGSSSFYVYGAPDRGAAFAQLYKGLKVRYNDSGQVIGEEPYNAGFGGLSGNEGEIIQTEGTPGLIGQFNVASFSCFEVCIGAFGVCVKMKQYDVTVDRSKPLLIPYGLRFEKKREGSSGWLSLAIGILSAVSIGFGALGSAAQIFTTVGSSILEGAAAGALAGALFPQDSLPPAGIAAEALAAAGRFMPPGFKPYPRAASKRFKTIQDALSAEGKPLLMDGVISVDKLDYDKLLTYRGNGILACFNNGAETYTPQLLAGVQADRTDPFGAESHLTIVYNTLADRLTPEAMLTLGNPGAADMNEATFMVTGGIKPAGPNTAIMGGVVSDVINKDKIDPGSNLEIYYNVQKLAIPAEGGQYDEKKFILCSISPKIAGWTDKFTMSPTGTITGGDDGLGGFTK